MARSVFIKVILSLLSLCAGSTICAQDSPFVLRSEELSIEHETDPLMHSQELTHAWESILPRTSDRPWAKENLVTELLDKSFAQLHLNEKIKKGSISSTNDKSFKGLYFPSDDLVILASPSEGTINAHVLFHEIVHAFQYRYRFPIDLYYLSRWKETNTVRAIGLRDYLAFYYEVNANWWTLSLGADPAWQEFRLGSSLGRLERGSKTFVAIFLGLLDMSPWKSATFPLPVLEEVPVFALSLVDEPTKLAYSDLGDADLYFKFSQMRILNGIKSDLRNKDPLDFRELVIQKWYPVAMGSNILRFHSHYGQRLTNAYGLSHHDKQFFNHDIHNRKTEGTAQIDILNLSFHMFMSHLFVDSQRDATRWQACTELWDEMDNSHQSPFLFWTDVLSDSNHPLTSLVESCYRFKVDAQLIEANLDLKDSMQMKDPRPSTEGSRPSKRIVLPQIPFGPK